MLLLQENHSIMCSKFAFPLFSTLAGAALGGFAMTIYLDEQKEKKDVLDRIARRKRESEEYERESKLKREKREQDEKLNIELLEPFTKENLLKATQDKQDLNKKSELNLLKNELYNIDIKDQIKNSVNKSDFSCELQKSHQYNDKQCNNLKQVLPDYKAYLLKKNIDVNVTYQYMPNNSYQKCYYNVSWANDVKEDNKDEIKK
jgi:hypothetical protein